MKPSKAVINIVAVAVDPTARTTVGPEVTAKSETPVATTLNASVVECDNEPLAPVTVIV